MKKSEVKIHTDYIKLDQLLKFSGISESGSMAKEMIFDGLVFVNGEICTMRGKKLRCGDVVSVNSGNEAFEVTVA